MNPCPGRAFALPLLAAFGVACTFPAPLDADLAAIPPAVSADAGQDPDAGAEPDAGTEPPDAGPPPCAQNTLALLTVNYGDTDRYYVAANLDGEDVALQLDTGSGLTFLYQGPGAPPYTPNAGAIQLGCELLPIAGRNLSPFLQTVEGLRVAGILGMDFLLRKPALLEIDARTLTRFAAFPAGLVGGAPPWVPFDAVLDHALVPCTVDGAPVRLMFDTGGGHTLIVGADGQPGDQVQYVQDAEGNVFPIYTGTGEIAFPWMPPRLVPMARAPEFPYFDQTVAALGGNLHGLLGVTSFPDTALLVSGAEGRIYLLPR